MAIPFDAAWGAAYLVVEALGIASAANAVMRVRTSQGAIAWTVSLVTFPLLALPLYWVFGRSRFHGYREALAQALEDCLSARQVEEFRAATAPHVTDVDPDFRAIDQLTNFHFLDGNRVELLVDGPDTFDAIFEAIASATEFILVEFFIIRSDDLGLRLQRALIDQARRGVRVFVLYDEVGSHRLGGRYVRDLREAGAEVSSFRTTQGAANRFQLNFRNHRKIVVVDGRVGFVGGHNVGDEYLGLNPKFGRWRDTHVRIAGPAVLQCQAIFLINWFWAVRSVPQLHWTNAAPCPENMPVQILPTGPVDDLDNCALLFHSLINRARQRLWIASPYFVPDEGIQQALQLAALRGVDVRILIPAKPDHLLVYLAAFSYLDDLCRAGVRFFRFHDGFLHQKAALVDDRLGLVGTANLDNRSLRLNFEISALVPDPSFAAAVAAMLESDFHHSTEIDDSEYRSRPLPFRIAVRVARLLSPIL